MAGRLRGVGRDDVSGRAKIIVDESISDAACRVDSWQSDARLVGEKCVVDWCACILGGLSPARMDTLMGTWGAR